MADAFNSFNPTLIPTTAGSGTTTYTSAVISAKLLSLISFIVRWSGGSTPVASITVEVSNDSQQAVDAGTAVWTALTLSGSPAISGASGSNYIQLGPIRAQFCRINVIWASGTGNFVVAYAGGRY